MKTIRPIVIESKGSKETILDLAKRGINAAEMNCSIVRLVIGGVDALVYPGEHITKIIHYVQLQTLTLRLRELENSK